MVTAARAQVQVEPVSWSAATFVAVSQVGAEMVTAVIHGCTGLLRYSHDRTGKIIIYPDSPKSG